MGFKERRDAKTEVTMVEGEPVIYIRPLALDKMALYVQCCDKEIGWLGSVVKHNNIFIIEDTYLFKQEVHATTCEISPEGLTEFVTELLTSDPENGMNIYNSLKLWGHSHVNMGVSPSGQDDTQTLSFKDNNEWFIRVIANKNGEMEFTVYDFKNGIKYKNVKWLEYREAQITLEEVIKAEIKEKVKEKTYTSNVSYVYGSGTTWKRGYEWDVDKKEWYDPELRKKKEEEAKGAPRRESIVKELKPGEYRSILDEITDEEIEETFTVNQIIAIADCKDMNDVKLIVDNLIPKNNYNEDDLVSIYMYAINSGYFGLGEYELE